MRSAATLLGLFVLGSLAFTACDGDDDTTSGTGGGSGTGGSAAKGGSSGKGGTSPEGGESGTSTGSSGKGGNNGVGGTASGTGGKSGNGGTSAGKGGSGATSGNGTGGGAGDGAAGASAAAGENGTGGTVGVTGGTGGTIGTAGAGAGGEAGNNGGEAGSGGPAPSAKACTYQCEVDEDCDPDHDITCVDGLCLDAGRACNDHDDCIAWASGQLTDACTQDEDCPYFLYGDLCMDIAGAGLCVSPPAAGICALGGEPTEATKFGSTDTATVCLDLSGRCDAHQCFFGCTANADCATSGSGARGHFCNTDSGKCGGCTGDGDCGGPGTSHCTVATGVCGCLVNGDCTGLAASGLDTCVAGTCSCSALSCSAFPDATASCG